MLKIKIHIAIFLLIVVIGSCMHPPVKQPNVITQKIPDKKYAVISHHVIGNSVENRPIKSLMIGESGATILIIAAVHGDECDGTGLVYRLAGYIYDHPEVLEGVKLILIPQINPDGCFHNYRYNLNGVDLNRNFPSSNHSVSKISGAKSLSEPETIALAKLVTHYRPQRIIAIHQPLACIDHDGPAEGLAEHIAKHSDLPICKLGAKHGSLGSYAGVNMEIPVVTIELPASAKEMSPDLLWNQYGNMMLSAISYPIEAK